MTNNLSRSTVKPSILVVAWVVLPLLFGGVAFLKLPLAVGLASCVLAMLSLLVLGWRLLRRTSEASFIGRGWIFEIDRLIERSFLGVGSLQGWTASNPDLSLAQLRGAEAPVEGFGQARTVQAQPSPQTNQVDRSARPAPQRTSSPAPEVASAIKVDKPRPVGPVTDYLVQRGDTYWSLAERLWGEGGKWPSIQELNVGREVGDGKVINEGDSLVPGWKILLPKVEEKK